MIIRSSQPFVMLDRRWIGDPNLSYTALGILAYLCSLQAGEQLDEYGLLGRPGASATSVAEIKAALWDLQRFGYLVPDGDGAMTLVDPHTAPATRQGDRA